MYPASVAVYGHGTSEGIHTLWSSSPSLLFATYCTLGQETAVITWFGDELTRDGWHSDAHPAGTTDADVAAVHGWTRGDRRFTLQVLSPAYVARLAQSRATQCTTGYRTSVQ